jgi:cytolysin-activating lysine-acyltransferase
MIMEKKENSEIKTSDTITVSSVLGEIVWLMTQSNRHRYNYFLADLEWLLMPAIMQGQFKLFHNEGKPVALAYWAFVSTEVSNRLTKGMSKLKTADWRSGNEVWLIDLVAPFGQSGNIIEELKNTVLADYVFKSFQVTPEGEKKIIEYQGANTISKATNQDG